MSEGACGEVFERQLALRLHIETYAESTSKKTPVSADHSSTFTSGLAISNDLRVDICANRGKARNRWMVTDHNTFRVGCV